MKQQQPEFVVANSFSRKAIKTEGNDEDANELSSEGHPEMVVLKPMQVTHLDLSPWHEVSLQ